MDQEKVEVELKIETEMTNNQALDIVRWRREGDVDDDGYGLSWRGIAYTFIKYYPDDAKKWNIEHTQPCGMMLCKIAFRLLGEKRSYLSF